MKFEKFKPGMVVYDIGRGRLGNTTLRTVHCWRVNIISVNAEKRTVCACWNSNPQREFTERTYKKWRESEPLLIGSAVGGKRLATREEIMAARSQNGESR